MNRFRRLASDKQMQLVGPVSLSPVLDFLLKKGVMLAVDKRFRLNPLLCELVVRELLRNGDFERVVDIVQRVIPLEKRYSHYQLYRNREEALREARIAFYRNDEKALQLVVQVYNQFTAVGWRRDEQLMAHEVVEEIVGNPFDLAAFEYEPRSLLLRSLAAHLTDQPLLPKAMVEKADLIRLIQGDVA